MVCAVWGVGVLQGWCLRCHQQRSHFQGNSHWYWWVAVTEEESHQVGESGWGLALGCYFQLQGTGAELTAKAFVHPARGRRVCLVVYVCWEMRGGRGAWERAGGREKGVGGRLSWDSGLCSRVWCGNWALTSVTLPSCCWEAPLCL